MTLSSKLIFLSLTLVPYFLLLKGEILNLKADDPGVVDALDFAMDEFNAMGNDLYRYMSTKVEEATVQVVSGRKFCIVSVIGKSKSCRNDKARKPVSLDLCPVDTPEMRCKFLVSVQWEKYRDLVSHKCFDLEEEIVSCKDESNFEEMWWLNMASQAERDGFDGIRPSIKDPAVKVVAPFGSGIEVNDDWTARILAFFFPFVVILLLIVIFCCLILSHNQEMAKMNAERALKWN